MLFALLLGGRFESDNGHASLTFGALAFSSVSLLFFGFYTFDARRIRARMDGAAQSRGIAEVSNVERLASRRLSSLVAPQAPPRTLDDIGKMLAVLAAALILQPVMLGWVVFTITGDLWRQLIFLPVALLAGASYWLRIRVALERLSESGLN